MIGKTNEEKTFALINLYGFSEQRQLYILRALRDNLNGDPKLEELKRLLDEAIAFGVETMDQRDRVQRQGNTRKRHNPGAAEMDRVLGRSLNGLVSRLRGEAECLDEDHPRARAATEVLESLFPNGLGAVTNLPYVEQATEVEKILDRLENPLADAVALLGLQSLVERIQHLQAQYLALLGPKERPEITPRHIAERRRKGDMKLRYIAAYILVHFGRAEVHDDETCEKLLGPILAQNEELAARHKERRAGRRIGNQLAEPAINPDHEADDADDPAEELAGPEAAL